MALAPAGIFLWGWGELGPTREGLERGSRRLGVRGGGGATGRRRFFKICKKSMKILKQILQVFKRFYKFCRVFGETLGQNKENFRNMHL